MPSDPYPKARQLARGERRYRRKVASPKQWQAIIAEKGNCCRICGMPSRDVYSRRVQYHHLVSRASALGDDVAANIVPLCGACHYRVTVRDGVWLHHLAESLSDAEYAYVIGKLGEGALERLFGVGRV
jgi:hypothetical protein